MASATNNTHAAANGLDFHGTAANPEKLIIDTDPGIGEFQLSIPPFINFIFPKRWVSQLSTPEFGVLINFVAVAQIMQWFWWETR